MIQDTSEQDRMIERGSWWNRMGWPGWVTLVVLIVLAGIAIPGISRWSQADSSFSRSRLRFAVVERGDLNDDLHVEGRIVASRYPTLFAPAEGLVTLYVRAGEAVKKGQNLLTIDSPALDSQLQQESSAVAAEEAQLERIKLDAKTALLNLKQDRDLKALRQTTAERALKRAEQSFSEGLINRVDYDAAIDALAVAKLEHTHAEASYHLARETRELELRNRILQLEQKRLVLSDIRRQVNDLDMLSPVDGVVGSIDVDPNDAVAPRQSLMTVVDLSAFEVELRIPETYADNIHLAAKVAIQYENQAYPGEVVAIAPEVNNSVVLGRARFSGHHPVGIKQNQRVSTQINIAQITDTLKVQRGPFLESGSGLIAYRLDGDLATRIPIRSGVSSMNEVQILEGLKEGDTIIISDMSRFEGVSKLLLNN